MMKPLTVFVWACSCLGLLFSLSSAQAALSSEDTTFLAALDKHSRPQLETPALGTTRQQERLQARVNQEVRNTPVTTESPDCGNTKACQPYGRPRYYAPDGHVRAHWFIWRGWLTWAPAYASAFIVGIAGLAVLGGNGHLDGALGAYFGMMLVPVVGPLVSFIVAMASVRGTGNDVWWILGAIGALATLIPQVVGFTFLLVGYTSLARWDRGRMYGKVDETKPFVAVTPYASPQGAGLAVFGQF